MRLTLVAVILRAELRAWRNRLLKSGSSRAVLLTLLLLGGAVVVGGTVFALADGASQLLPYARDSMLVGAFTVLSILMLVVGFPTVITNFFVGTDLMQLVLAPVRPLEIFLARSALAMRANLLLGFVIVMFVVGVGAGAGASPAYFVLGGMLVVLQVLIVTAIQALLLSLILRWVPARLARDVSVIAASFSGAAIYLLWQVTLRQTIGRRPDVSGLLAFARRIDWLPAAWPGHALSALLRGSAGSFAEWLGATVVLAATLVVVAGALYGQTLVTGLGQLGGAAPRWRVRGARVAPRAGAGRAGRDRAVSPQLSIAFKDWLTYRRDVRRLSRLLPAVIFLVGYAVILNRPSRGALGFWNDALVVTFVSMFTSMAVATSAVPSERRGFQLLRMAPITMGGLLRAKVLYSMSPLLGLTAAISLGVAIAGGNSFGDVLQLLALSLWVGFGFIAIGVAVGAIDPRFEAADERRMVGPGGTLAGLTAELGFGGLSLLAFTALHLWLQAFVLPPRAGLFAWGPLAGFGLAGGGVVVAAGAAGVVWLLLRTAGRRLVAFEQSINAT